MYPKQLQTTKNLNKLLLYSACTARIISRDYQHVQGWTKWWPVKFDAVICVCQKVLYQKKKILLPQYMSFIIMLQDSSSYKCSAVHHKDKKGFWQILVNLVPAVITGRLKTLHSLLSCWPPLKIMRLIKGMVNYHTFTNTFIKVGTPK